MMGGAVFPPTAEEEQQHPKIPPKKRHAYTSVSSSLQGGADDVYAFDTLVPATGGVPVATTKPATPPPYVPSSLRQSNIVVDDDIYTFDTLETAPPIPNKAAAKIGGRSTSVSGSAPPTAPPIFQPSYNDENIYEFDELEELPPPPRQDPFPARKITPSSSSSSSPSPAVAKSVDATPPPIPKKVASIARSVSSGSPRPQATPTSPLPPPQPSYQFHDDENVYSFDALEPTVATPPPPVTMAVSKPVLQAEQPQLQLQMHDDDQVYSFDQLEPDVVATSQGQSGGSWGNPPNAGLPPYRPPPPLTKYGSSSGGVSASGVPPKTPPQAGRKASSVSTEYL